MMKNTRQSVLLPVLLSACLAAAVLSGCSSRSDQPPQTMRPAQVTGAKTETGRHQLPARPFFKDLSDDSEKPQSPPPPKFKEISPLKTEHISISFVDEDYRQIYQLLARAAGLNLVLDPGLENLPGSRKLTAEFQENSLESILDTVSSILNVSWREENSTLFIEPFVSKTFHLDFILSTNTSQFDVGGDVLGSTDAEEISSPLTGSFKIAGKIGDNVSDIYTNIENTVGTLIENDGEFILNRQTGTVLVRTRPRRLRQIAQYLETLREKYTRQVLIEAQIMEVTLNKTKNLGIDWQQVVLRASEVTLPGIGIENEIVDLTGASRGNDDFYTLAIQADKYNLNGIFRALRSYGDIRMLSNPRIKAMNGQAAMISVGQSISYLRSLEETTSSASDGSVDTSVSTEIGSIFDGILLGVTPVIKNDGSVSLHIIPIKSELVSMDQQQLAGGAYTITFPKVNLREISTVIDVKPDHIVMLGGLIMDKQSDTTTEVPILADLPLFGNMFRQEATAKQKVEMVIILKLKVLN